VALAPLTHGQVLLPKKAGLFDRYKESGSAELAGGVRPLFTPVPAADAMPVDFACEVVEVAVA
jgi:hypothetical protein